MFRQGKPRTFIHNLKLASMLSFVAGIVNINGVLAAQTLTTNVTGHFAFFAADFVQHRYQHALMFILYILFFLLGAFVCSILLEMFLRVRPAFSHAVPMFIEMTLLITVAFNFFLMNDYVIACVLLFAMGLQNALVTRISKSTVRTTHLTGLFTDLGIELSQLFFYKLAEESKKLRRSIYLRIVIILFFFFRWRPWRFPLPGHRVKGSFARCSHTCHCIVIRLCALQSAVLPQKVFQTAELMILTLIEIAKSHHRLFSGTTIGTTLVPPGHAPMCCHGSHPGML